MTVAAITKNANKQGVVEYHLEFDSAWGGLDSFVHYLQKHWQAEVTESADLVYSRRWVLRTRGIPISVYHDSQRGNSFVREDGVADQALLEQIQADLIWRLESA